MRQTKTVSNQEKITLPADIRNPLSITDGDIEMYNPEQIAEWGEQDRIGDAERKVILKHLPKSSRKAAQKRG
jgi:hypothetical protein